jgi:hypothetical protein
VTSFELITSSTRVAPSSGPSCARTRTPGRDLRIDSDPAGGSLARRLVSLAASAYPSVVPASRAGVAPPRSDSGTNVARRGRTFLHVASCLKWGLPHPSARSLAGPHRPAPPSQARRARRSRFITPPRARAKPSVQPRLYIALSGSTTNERSYPDARRHRRGP